METRFKYALPRAEVFLDITARSIIWNLRNGNDNTIMVPSLIQRAYMLVNETGVIPYKDYPEDVIFTG